MQQSPSQLVCGIRAQSNTADTDMYRHTQYTSPKEPRATLSLSMYFRNGRPFAKVVIPIRLSFIGCQALEVYHKKQDLFKQIQMNGLGPGGSYLL